MANVHVPAEQNQCLLIVHVPVERNQCLLNSADWRWLLWGLTQDGQRVLAELFGPDHVEHREARKNSFNEDFLDFVTEVCFGRVWTRSEIDRKQRSMITLAMLIALNKPTSMKNHLNAALDMGCTVEEIAEIILHSAIYCGLPAAGVALQGAEEVLRARRPPRLTPAPPTANCPLPRGTHPPARPGVTSQDEPSSSTSCCVRRR